MGHCLSSDSCLVELFVSFPALFLVSITFEPGQPHGSWLLSELSEIFSFSGFLIFFLFKNDIASARYLFSPCSFRCSKWAFITLFPCLTIFPITFFSLYGSASLSTIFIAPLGQLPMQAPSPSQNKSLTSLALPSIICNAPSGQSGMHKPQPLHFFSSIWIIFLSAIFHLFSNCFEISIYLPLVPLLNLLFSASLNLSIMDFWTFSLRALSAIGYNMLSSLKMWS